MELFQTHCCLIIILQVISLTGISTQQAPGTAGANPSDPAPPPGAPQGAPATSTGPGPASQGPPSAAGSTAPTGTPTNTGSPGVSTAPISPPANTGPVGGSTAPLGIGSHDGSPGILPSGSGPGTPPNTSQGGPMVAPFPNFLNSSDSQPMNAALNQQPWLPDRRFNPTQPPPSFQFPQFPSRPEYPRPMVTFVPLGSIILNALSSFVGSAFEQPQQSHA